MSERARALAICVLVCTLEKAHTTIDFGFRAGAIDLSDVLCAYVLCILYILSMLWWNGNNVLLIDDIGVDGVENANEKHLRMRKLTTL